MTDDRQAIALEALRAAGHDQAAALAAAILQPESPAPAEAAPAAPAAEAEALPDGIMSREEFAAFERMPSPRSYREQQAQVAAIDRYVSSADYYSKQEGS